MVPALIERWHQIVRSRDMATLERLPVDDVVFASPVVHTPQASSLNQPRNSSQPL